MSKSKNKFNMGFTLVESLVSISILSLSIAATFTAVQVGLKSSIYAKDEVTAFYLTQEAMEFIKNTRDTNALYSLNGTVTNWLTGLVVTSGGASGPCDYSKVCTIDSQQNLITNCSSGTGTCPVLNRNTSTGAYSYATGANQVATTYRREIKLATVANNTNEVLVTITTSWMSGAASRSFQITQSLYNKQ